MKKIIVITILLIITIYYWSGYFKKNIITTTINNVSINKDEYLNHTINNKEKLKSNKKFINLPIISNEEKVNEEIKDYIPYILPISNKIKSSYIYNEILALDECSNEKYKITTLINDGVYSAIVTSRKVLNTFKPSIIQPLDKKTLKTPDDYEILLSIDKAKDIIYNIGVYNYIYNGVILPCINDNPLGVEINPYHSFSSSVDTYFVGVLNRDVLILSDLVKNDISIPKTEKTISMLDFSNYSDIDKKSSIDYIDINKGDGIDIVKSIFISNNEEMIGELMHMLSEEKLSTDVYNILFNDIDYLLQNSLNESIVNNSIKIIGNNINEESIQYLGEYMERDDVSSTQEAEVMNIILTSGYNKEIEYLISNSKKIRSLLIIN